jgi:hypothetical protein
VATDDLPYISAISLREPQMLVLKGSIRSVVRFNRWLGKIAVPEIINIFRMIRNSRLRCTNCQKALMATSLTAGSLPRLGHVMCRLRRMCDPQVSSC